MKTTKITGLLALLVWLCIPTVASAFQCSDAKAFIERFICQYPDVKKQDDEMSGLYFKLAAQKIILNPTQPLWLRKQRDLCPDVACLRSVYAARIDYFNSLLEPQHSPPVTTPTPPPPTPMPQDLAEAVEAAQAISQMQPQAVAPVTPPPTPAPATIPPPVASSAATTAPQPPPPIAAKPIEKPAPPPSDSFWHKAGSVIGSIFKWIVIFALLFGLYKAIRLPEAQQLVKSSLFKLGVVPEYSVQGRRLSLLRVFIIILPIVALTLWLLYNVVDIIAAGSGLDPFHSQPVCSPPPQPTSFSPYEFNRYQAEAENYIAQHPECAPQARPSTGRVRFMDMVESKGFLLPYYFWALPFALYLNYRLFIKKSPLDLKGLIWVFFLLSIALSPVPLSLLWPLLPSLPKTPGWISFLLIVPGPPLVMMTFGSAAITLFFGGIFSLISGIALPIVALFNQINMFMITRKRQELQATGVYVWLVEFEHWLTNTPMPELPPDDSKGARFATPKEISSIIAPPSFTQGGTRP